VQVGAARFGAVPNDFLLRRNIHAKSRLLTGKASSAFFDAISMEYEEKIEHAMILRIDQSSSKVPKKYAFQFR